MSSGNVVSAAIGRSHRKGLARLAVALLAASLLASCKTDLYTDLDQRRGNEIAATLIHHGIPAERNILKGGRMTVTIDRERFAEAVAVLKDAGLPRQEFSTLGEVFKKDSLISSPTQDRAQMIFALSQELSRTVSDIDGVLSARVHLVLPENDPLRQQLIPSSASVFIRHRRDVPIENLVPKVKMLVANGIAGLSYDKVSVVAFPVEMRETAASVEPMLVSFYGLWLHRDSVALASWMFYGSIVLLLSLAGALVLLIGRGRGRFYPLRPAAIAKVS